MNLERRKQLDAMRTKMYVELWVMKILCDHYIELLDNARNLLGNQDYHSELAVWNDRKAYVQGELDKVNAAN